MQSILEIRNISKRFDGVKALNQFSASIEPHKVTGLVGPNGAGKTTLFDIISRFIDPDEGEILFDGVSLSHRRPHELRGLGIARTFQITKLFYSLTVRENLFLASRHKEDNNLLKAVLQGANGFSKQKIDLYSSNDVIEQLDLSGFLDQKAEELSHGWAKLTSLLCALAAKPRLLLLDEPISGINHIMVERMLQILEERVKKKELTILIIEHNLTTISSFCDNFIVMHQGQKVAEGPPEILHHDDRVLSVYTGI